jgi:hypothetical protein
MRYYLLCIVLLPLSVGCSQAVSQSSSAATAVVELNSTEAIENSSHPDAVPSPDRLTGTVASPAMPPSVTHELAPQLQEFQPPGLQSPALQGFVPGVPEGSFAPGIAALPPGASVPWAHVELHVPGGMPGPGALPVNKSESGFPMAVPNAASLAPAEIGLNGIPPGVMPLASSITLEANPVAGKPIPPAVRTPAPGKQPSPARSAAEAVKP